MATLKLSTDKNSGAVKTTKAPVRRADPAKRDRTKPPSKPVVREQDAEPGAENPKMDGRSSKLSDASFSRLRGNDVNATKPAGSQRNHRFDGKPRDTEAHSTPKQPKPAAVDMRNVPRPDKNEPQYRQTPRRGGKVRDGFDARKSASHSPTLLPSKQGEGLTSELPRLSKIMAERGLCSRREADEWIVNGWVKVDGIIVDTLGTRIKPDAEIVISGYATEHQAENVTIILHKPVGYVSGQAEDGYQPAIVLVHPDNQWPDDPELHKKNPKQFHRGMLRNLAPAGRLDIDSTGMLVLTQDGRIARHLIGEDSSVEKEYLVRVQGELSDADLKRLNFGLSLDGVKLKPAKVSWQNEDQLRFVLREGKKRQIRRMCEMVGLHVIGLKRIRIGSVTLGKLPVGQWRYLRTDERF